MGSFSHSPQEIMEDPVVAADGHTYERQAIQTWLQRRVSSPLTNAPMGHRGVTPNENLRKLIQEFVEARPELARRDQARIGGWDQARRRNLRGTLCMPPSQPACYHPRPAPPASKYAGVVLSG